MNGKRRCGVGTFLVMQWLRLCTPNAQGLGSISGGETDHICLNMSSHAATKTQYSQLRNAGLEETQAGIKIARRNINHLSYADDTTLLAENEELKSLMMKVKEESKRAGLKLSFQKNEG